MKSQNKLITLSQIIFYPALTVSLIVVLILAGLTVSGEPTPDWLVTVGVLSVGISTLVWSVVIFVIVCIPTIKDLGRELKTIIRVIKRK